MSPGAGSIEPRPIRGLSSKADLLCWMGFSMAKHVVLERLNKLVAKGYVVRWEESEQDTVRLQHPRAPDLTLFSDGRIWVLTVSPDDWIAAENEADQPRFQPFVSPNELDRSRERGRSAALQIFRAPYSQTDNATKPQGDEGGRRLDTCRRVDCLRSLCDGSGIPC